MKIFGAKCIGSDIFTQMNTINQQVKIKSSNHGDTLGNALISR